MRIAMLGSGGIGGYYGTLLARAGHDVVFIARGAHLEAMQRYGLTVRTPTGESTLPVTAVADTGRVEPVDLVLFSVKSYDTEPAAHSLAPLMARDTVVLTVQNGLDNAESIASVVGFEAVLAGSAYVALQLASPGVVVRTGGEGRIVFGERGGVVTERVQRLSKALSDAGIPYDVSTAIDRVLWQKFLFIAGIGGVAALARSGIGPLLGSARGRALLAASCEEIVAVARAEGAPLQSEAVASAIEQAAMLPPQWRSSLARDLEDGRRLEVEALSGAVVQRGLKHVIATPVHQAIAACLSVHQPGTSDTQHHTPPLATASA